MEIHSRLSSTECPAVCKHAATVLEIPLSYLVVGVGAYLAVGLRGYRNQGIHGCSRIVKAYKVVEIRAYLVIKVCTYLVVDARP